jgi:phosphate transport system protein
MSGAQHPVAQHTVKSYGQELQQLRSLITEMGGLVESQVSLATQAIVNQDSATATRAVELDLAVDVHERDAEQMVIRMLALRQPMADDLRQIVAAMKITAAMERIGDYAKNIARRSIVLDQYRLPFSLTGVANMSRLVQENLKLVIDAIGENDAQKAMQVWQADQAIDEIYNSIFRELITYMMEDARNITPCTHLLFIAKNLERIGDHATNIAEHVHYAVTGEPLTEERPKGDGSSYAVVRLPDDVDLG